MQHQKRARIGKLNLDPVTMEEAIQFVADRLKMPGGPATIIETVNAQFVCVGDSLRRFASFVRNADLVVADGMSLVGASRLLGDPLPERVTGVDMVPRMCEEAAKSGNSVYFFGGRPGMAEETSRRMVRRFSALKVAGCDCPLYGFEKNPGLDAQVFERVKVASPDILFVALGAPKQEYWTEDHIAGLNVKIVIGVGGTFEMLAGLVQRAPRWIQQVGLEWAYRLVQDPRRLWKRYVFGNVHFLAIVALQWVKQAIEKRRTAPAESATETDVEAPVIQSKHAA